MVKGEEVVKSIYIKDIYKRRSIIDWVQTVPGPRQTRSTYGGLGGMPACGQTVGCGVCDTPERWRGAAGLCARVRACAGAAESVHAHIHMYLGRVKRHLVCSYRKDIY